MRLIVHLGAFKTGSTAIQQALASGSHTLAGAGARYAETGRRPGFEKHLDLYDHIVDDGTNTERHRVARAADLRTRLRTEVADFDGDVLIVSDEEFSHPSSAVADWFADLGDIVDVVPVFVVRSQADLLESLHRQWTKEPARSCTQPLADALTDETFLRRADHWATLDPWIRRFDDAVRVLSYEELRFDLVGAFCRSLDLPVLDATGDRNRSLTAAQAELLRRVGLADPSLARMRLAERYLSTNVHADPASALSDTDRENLRRRFGPGNDSIADLFGIQVDAGGAALPALTDVDLFDRSLGDAADIVARLWRDLLATEKQLRQRTRQLARHEGNPERD